MYITEKLVAVACRAIHRNIIKPNKSFVALTLFAGHPDPGSLPFRVLFYFLVLFATGCAYIVGHEKMAWHSIKTDENRKGTGDGIPLS